MSEITLYMIDYYCIKQLGYDFMGFQKINNNEILTYHHLLIPKRCNGEKTLENGVLLYRTSHDYLHLIEVYDLDIFDAITSEMLDMVIKGYLDMENILQIDKLLCQFEDKYINFFAHDQSIIKNEYTRRLIKKR